MDQLLFTVIALGIALLGFVLLAWQLVDKEHEYDHEPHVHDQPPYAGKHPWRRD